MTPFPGVIRRADSTVWWFALRAPQDLLHRFDGGPWAARCSLKTRDLREANTKARVLQSEWSQRFDAMRREDNPQRVELNAALVATIAAELRRWMLQADDNMRDYPEMPNALLRLERQKLIAEGRGVAGRESLLIGVDPVPDPLAGLTEEQQGAVARFNARYLSEAAIAVARRDRLSMLPWAELISKHMGLSIDWKTTEGSDALLQLLKTFREATADLVRRDSGDLVETPPDAGPQQAPQTPLQPSKAVAEGHTPMDAFNAWEKLKPGRPRKSVATYRAAAVKLASMLPGRTLESLTRADGRTVVAKLLDEAEARGPKGQNTASNLLGRFKTLLAQAVDLEWIDKNPFQGRTVERTKSTRKPWSIPQLVKLFDDPLFTAYQLPAASMAGLDAAYWLPLLGLYTGARISELAQLHTDDVQRTADAGWVVSIKEDADEGQGVKNKYSIRSVPVHPELERLGFIAYATSIREHGPGPLWPAVVRSELNGAGGKVSQWFGEYKTGKGFGEDHVFHSFRHTLETELRALAIPKYQIAALAGHAGEDVSDDYAHLTPAILRPVLERLSFPGLDLPQVFMTPSWKPVE